MDIWINYNGIEEKGSEVNKQKRVIREEIIKAK